MEPIERFCNRHNIRAESVMVDENPSCPDWQYAYHYKVTLKGFRRQLTVYFSMGYGHSREPEAVDVLECLALDASGVENASFEEWASEYGYDTDSRKAERTFKLYERQAAQLRRFLGDHFETLVFGA